MILKFLLLFAFVLKNITGQQEGCSVCGDGKEVGDPSAVFVFPGQPSVPCGVLEQAGLSGAIPLDQCSFLPPLLSTCECGPVVQSPFAVSPNFSPIDESDATSSPDSFPYLFESVPPSLAPQMLTQSSLSPSAAPTNRLQSVFPTDSPAPSPPPSISPTYSPSPSSFYPSSDIAPTIDYCSTKSNQYDVFIDVSGNIDEVDSESSLLELSFELAYQQVVASNFCQSLQNVTLIAAFEPMTRKRSLEDTGRESCSVCGAGQYVGNPDEIYSFPREPEMTCGELEEKGKQGLIPLDRCVDLPLTIKDLCGCQPVEIDFTLWFSVVQSCRGCPDNLFQGNDASRRILEEVEYYLEEDESEYYESDYYESEVPFNSDCEIEYYEEEEYYEEGEYCPCERECVRTPPLASDFLERYNIVLDQQNVTSVSEVLTLVDQLEGTGPVPDLGGGYTSKKSSKKKASQKGKPEGKGKRYQRYSEFWS